MTPETESDTIEVETAKLDPLLETSIIETTRMPIKRTQKTCPKKRIPHINFTILEKLSSLVLVFILEISQISLKFPDF